MVINNLCICVLWMEVALALEGLKPMNKNYLSVEKNPLHRTPGSFSGWVMYATNEQILPTII